jgi:hypothetical protein
MGAGCSTAAARRIENSDHHQPPSTPASAAAAAAALVVVVGEAAAAGRVAVYQRASTGACVLVPLPLAAAPPNGSADNAAVAAAERLLGPEWRRVPLAAVEQARVLAAVAPPRPDTAATAGAAAGVAADGDREDDDLSLGEPVEEAWPPAWAEDGAAGADADAAGLDGRGGGGEEEEEEDPLVAAQRRQQQRGRQALQPALRCRVCGREVPNKALLNEHLAACLLVAEAREQTRATDEGLRMLAGDLRRLLEEQMRFALHAGGWVRTRLRLCDGLMSSSFGSDRAHNHGHFHLPNPNSHQPSSVSRGRRNG